MNTRKLTLSAILLAIGTLLHLIIPGIIAGMKPDFLLMTIFLAIFLNMDYKSALVVSILGGILAAMTTTLPGGQIPNIIDKPITGLIIVSLARIIDKGPGLNFFWVAALAFIGTLISGAMFIGIAGLVAGLPEGMTFLTMFVAIVLPTAIFTGFLTGFFYRILKRIIDLKR